MSKGRLQKMYSGDVQLVLWRRCSWLLLAVVDLACASVLFVCSFIGPSTVFGSSSKLANVEQWRCVTILRNHTGGKNTHWNTTSGQGQYMCWMHLSLRKMLLFLFYFLSCLSPSAATKLYRVPDVRYCVQIALILIKQLHSFICIVSLQ